jgi:hypothetical protein
MKTRALPTALCLAAAMLLAQETVKAAPTQLSLDVTENSPTSLTVTLTGVTGIIVTNTANDEWTVFIPSGFNEVERFWKEPENTGLVNVVEAAGPEDLLVSSDFSPPLGTMIPTAANGATVSFGTTLGGAQCPFSQPSMTTQQRRNPFQNPRHLLCWGLV